MSTIPDSEKIIPKFLLLNYKNSPLFTRQYYDQPEGHDLVGKLIATNRYSIAAGYFVGSIDVALYTKPNNLVGALGRFAFWITPFVGMATAYTTVTYAATQVRNKDDTWNNILGAFAAGGIWGAWRRNHVTGYTLGFFLAIAATIKKLSKIEGWEFFPEIEREPGNIRTHKKDYSLTHEGKKGYVSYEAK